MTSHLKVILKLRVQGYIPPLHRIFRWHCVQNGDVFEYMEDKGYVYIYIYIYIYIERERERERERGRDC
jgi:hypothetical protein